MIQRNKHFSGRIGNITFGLCSIADGLIRVFSLGFCHTTLTLDLTRKQTKKRFVQLRKEADSR